MGEARIIIPTLFHEEYVDCQRQLSRQDTPDGFIRALSLAQQWTVAFDYADVNALIESVRRTNALERSRAQFRLTMPDGSPRAGTTRREAIDLMDRRKARPTGSAQA